MAASVVIWEYAGDPPNAVGEVLCWRCSTRSSGVSSIPRYVEDHAERLRAKYVAFIHDLGESRIDGRRVIDHLDMGDGFSFWWMTQLVEKSPFKSPRIYDCLRLLALEEILLDRKPSSLTFSGSDRDLAHAIRRLCLNLKITFIWQSAAQSKQNRTLRQIYRGLPYPIQGVISLVRYLVLKWPLSNLKRPQWFSGRNSIFLLSYFIHLDPVSCAEGRFYSRQWGELTKCLHDNGWSSNWIHHFLFSPVVPNVRTGLGWLRHFNSDPKKREYHSFIESYLSWRVVFKALRSWFRLNLVSRRLRKVQAAFCPKMSAVWLWPMLRNDWFTSLMGQVAVNNCLWVELFDAALKEMPHQKIGLYLFENQGWESALLRAWRRYGHGEIIGVQHATVPFWHLYYVNDPRSLAPKQSGTMPMPDRLAVNGPAAWAAFSGTGYPVEQLVEVEALRYLNLERSCKAGSLKSASLGVNVLVLGDLIPDSMHNLLRLLEDAIKVLPDGYTFTFKPHPAYEVRLADYSGLRIEQTTAALDLILNKYDVVFAANSTSASVDAYTAGLPVIIRSDGGELNLSPLRGHSGVCFVSAPEELVEALEKTRKSVKMNCDHDEFFFLDAKLPRWRRLLTPTIST